MTPKIEDVIDPVVGKFYLVPVAKYNDKDGKLVVVPIIGIKHGDKAFGGRAGMDHWHIDGRFTNRKNERRFNVYDGFTNAVVWHDSVVLDLSSSMRLLCRRLFTGIKPPDTSREYFEWYRTWHGKKCAGRACPHFGTAMLKVRDGYRCPLHGLKANAGGIIIPVWEDL